MKAERVLGFVLGIILMGVMVMPSWSRAGENDKKAVYHCDFGNAKRADAMLRNIYNLVNYYTTHNVFYDVRVVANSACVQFLLSDRKGTKFEAGQVDNKLAKSITERMKSLADAYNVKFEQCEITLKSFNIDKSKLKPFVTLTPSGQVRVVELQNRGFAYIKVE